MSTIIDDPATLLAQRIRHERTARGWSLADLAERSAVAKATISKIEREEMSPTAATLVRLAGAFELTLAGLLLRAEGGGSRLVRAAEQPQWRDPDTGYRRRQIFSRPDHPVEIVQVTLPPGRRVAFPAASYAHIRQAVWVQTGELVIIEAGVPQALSAGDCLGFGPPAEVTLANETADPCSYLVVLARGSAIMPAIHIAALHPDPSLSAMLAEILVETVAHGGSVSFMHPLAPEAARAFWDAALAAAARNERIVLGAWDGDRLVGTVTLLLDCPPNQPHRAEIAKLMTRVSHRGRGVATALMQAAEALAVQRGRSLLVLDTATEGGAAGLYEQLGFTLTGEVPDYALKPHGGLTGTLIYWKRIGGG